MRVATVLLIAALSATGSVAGQAVRGQLIDSISRAPLPGAFVTLVDELPAYSQRINDLVDNVATQVDQAEKRTYEVVVPKRFQEQPSTQSNPASVTRPRRKKTPAEAAAAPAPAGQPAPIPEVRIHSDPTPLFAYVYGYLRSFYDVLLMASFVPFLVYFMLSWHHHVRSATVMLFRMEHRHTAYVALGLISAMIRSFMVGNLLIGLFLGAVSTLIFWLLHVPFFYLVGFVSGFLSLVPYLGVVLAIAPPLFVGLEHLGSQDIFAISFAVIALHLLALNVLYPKFLGNRMQLNPLAVTMSLLLWAWIWGAIGLVLAVPITAAMKIVFDHIASLKPYGDWLGE